MTNPHVTRFVLGVICILALTLSSLALPSARNPILLLVVLALFATWRQLQRGRAEVSPGTPEAPRRGTIGRDHGNVAGSSRCSGPRRGASRPSGAE